MLFPGLLGLTTEDLVFSLSNVSGSGIGMCLILLHTGIGLGFYFNFFNILKKCAACGLQKWYFFVYKNWCLCKHRLRLL